MTTFQLYSHRGGKVGNLLPYRFHESQELKVYAHTAVGIVSGVSGNSKNQKVSVWLKRKIHIKGIRGRTGIPVSPFLALFSHLNLYQVEKLFEALDREAEEEEKQEEEERTSLVEHEEGKRAQR